MKKLRGFTLLESLAVIGIVGIVSTAIFNMRNIGNDYTDYRKEASNIIYKEINQSLKDFQRNKVWIDPSGNAHKISSFQIKFGTQNCLLQGEGETLGPVLEIGNTYLYCLDENKKIIDCFLNGEISNDVKRGSGFFDSNKLISETTYTSPKKIKDIDKFEFLLEGGYKIDAINILPNGNIAEGDYIDLFEKDVYNSINSPSNTSTYNGTDNKEIYCKKAYESCLEQVPTVSEGGSCYRPFGRDYRCCNHDIIIDLFEPPCTNPTTSCVKCMDSSDKELWQQLQMEKCLKNKGFYDVRLNCQEVLLLSNSTLVDPSGGTENNTTSYSFTIYAAEKNGAKNCTVNLESKKPNNNEQSTNKLDINEDTKKAIDTLVEFCNNNTSAEERKEENNEIKKEFEEKSEKILGLTTNESINIKKGLDFFLKIRKYEEFKDFRPTENDRNKAILACGKTKDAISETFIYNNNDKYISECCKNIIATNNEIKKAYPEDDKSAPSPTTTNKKGKEWRPVGKITINTITKTASLERCNNDRESNGIDCGKTYCY